MSQPTQTQVHINRPLTNMSVAYIQSQAAFVATKVFPVVPVDKQSDSYYVYTKNDWFRDEAELRAPATESAGSGYGVTPATYNCRKWAIHKDIPDDVRNNEDSPLNSDRDATEFVTQRMLLRKEIQWTADYFTTGKWGTDITPTNLWSNYATSDPIADVRAGVRAILAVTGMKPNKLVLGYDVFTKLQDHPDIVARFQYTGAAQTSITRQQMAGLFDIGEVMVCEAVKATNNEGETAAYDFVQGKHALLVYAAPSPSLLAPSGGYHFAWKGVSGGLGETVAVKKMRMDLKEADRIEGNFAFDNKLVAADLGYFFNGAVA